MNHTTQRMIVGISGASGAIYGIRLLGLLRQLGVESHLVISQAGGLTITEETPYSLAEVREMADFYYSPKDMAAAISSGSFRTLGMVAAPCSMRSLAEIASGVTTSLLGRAADVVLKERRRLVLMVRETPFTTIHLENMQKVTAAGGIIAPPVPAFYTRPKSLEAMVDYSLGRVLDLFGLEVPQMPRWEGLSQPTGIVNNR
jgi:4-hydroxy-3-polyprenylbenzoate decarboxylase